MADQMKTSVVGLNLEIHGVIIYACVRSTPEFLDMNKESRKALAKELLELKVSQILVDQISPSNFVLKNLDRSSVVCSPAPVKSRQGKRIKASLFCNSFE